MRELVSQFDPTDQPLSDEDEIGGGGDTRRPEDPWILKGGIGQLWPEAVRHGWTDDVGLDPKQKAILEAAKK